MGKTVKAGKETRVGIALNEDFAHFFISRAGQNINVEKVESWVDQYAQTQVRELMLGVNAMRTSYASKVWDPIWLNYDPFPEEREQAIKTNFTTWRHTAWQLYKNGIDVYEIWIRRCRDKNISPWISMRMNDVHEVNDEQSFVHSEFWRNNAQLRRVSYKFTERTGKAFRFGSEEEFAARTDKAFDYGREEVRRHSMNLIEELVEKYDFDGLELDWMRSGFHFRPGYESEGALILTDFMSRVRCLLDGAEQKRGHKINLGARVPSRPRTAADLGMDGVAWARKGLVDMLVITPLFTTIETDMPVELWKQLLDGTNVTLATGLELLIQPYPQCKCRPWQTNSLETVRGTAISFLDRGADRIYLFNYFDSGAAGDVMDDLHNYPALLREIGSIDTITGKSRRHMITFSDTWAPGEPRATILPALSRRNEWKEFRVHIGPKPDSGKIIAVFGLLGGSAIEEKTMKVRINGEPCDFVGSIHLSNPTPDFPVYGFDVPLSAVKRGYNLIETVCQKKITVGWVELKITP